MSRFCTRGTALSKQSKIYERIARKYSAATLRTMGFSPSVEGTIEEVVDEPFGFLLKDIIMWQQVEENPHGKTLAKVKLDIKRMFIRSSEISRIDFLE